MEHPIAQLASLQARLSGWSGGWNHPFAMNEVYDNQFHVDKTTVCIYGSSLIDHLATFAATNPMEKGGINSQLNIPGIFCYWRGIPGLSLTRVWDESKNGIVSYNGMGAINYARNSVRPDVGIFLWGGNDIDNGENWEAITDLMLAFANVFHCVSYVLTILPRPSPKFSDPEVFRERAEKVNKQLHYHLEENRTHFPLIRRWKVTRFDDAGTVEPIQIFLDDGIHLHDNGNLRLYHNIRKAAIAGIKRFQEGVITVNH